MLDASAVQALTQAQAVTATATAITNAVTSVLGRAVAAIPNDFEVKDFEPYLPTRRRARGVMTTSAIADFAAYTQDHAEPGASVFVDKDRMAATAVLNLGTPDQPGHADNLAVAALDKSAAFAALLAIANGQPRKQSDVAEFLEDWQNFVTCRADDVLGTPQAIAAIRKITIESARKVETEEKALGTSRSAFESVQASSTEQLPTHIEFVCDSPYFGLSTRIFNLRLSVLTTDKPLIVLRIVKLEEHQEGMAGEFSRLVREALGGDIPVALGAYQRK